VRAAEIRKVQLAAFAGKFSSLPGQLGAGGNGKAQQPGRSVKLKPPNPKALSKSFNRRKPKRSAVPAKGQ